MTLEFWVRARHQRSLESKAAAKMARVLRNQFGDAALPSNERGVEVKKFSPETKEALERECCL